MKNILITLILVTAMLANISRATKIINKSNRDIEDIEVVVPLPPIGVPPGQEWEFDMDPENKEVRLLLVGSGRKIYCPWVKMADLNNMVFVIDENRLCTGSSNQPHSQIKPVTW